jgi:hypothetical protein
MIRNVLAHQLPIPPPKRRYCSATSARRKGIAACPNTSFLCTPMPTTMRPPGGHISAN